MAWNGGSIRATGVPKIAVSIALGAAGGTIDTNGFDGEISGAMIGPGGITKNGAGKLKLSGANSFGSPITVNAGGLAIASANSLGATPQVFLAAGTTLDIRRRNRYGVWATKRSPARAACRAALPPRALDDLAQGRDIRSAGPDDRRAGAKR
jgi:autotransporter-associated beta strand protein